MMEPSESAPEGNAAQIAYWNDRAAQTWTMMQERLDQAFAALTHAALERAAPAAGEHVLDVGCGCGATVLELAHRVGAAGRVLGLDVSAPMAGRARQRVEAAGLRQADILIADAAAHEFIAAADLLFSRFGVMFFADPAGAFRNLRRAMRPGGRLLFAAWRDMADNPFFTLPMEATRHLVPPQPPSDPAAPGPMAFADADRVRRVLSAAGWRTVELERCDSAIMVGKRGDLAQAAEFLTRIGPLGRILAEAEPGLRRQAEAALTDALASHSGADGITLPASVWLVSAQA